MLFLKLLLKFSSFIIIILLFITLLFSSKDKDVCLDTGFCKEGLEVNTRGYTIIINEQTCKANEGIWITKKKICNFKTNNRKK